MSLPSHLDQLMRDGLTAIQRDSAGHLERPYRERVYDAFGSRVDQVAPHHPGHVRRTTIALLAVEHVLPVWQSIWPDDRWPQEMLHVASQALHGDARDVAAAEKAWGSHRSGIDDFYGEDRNQHFAAYAVLEAALRAITVAVNDTRDIDAEDDQLSDKEISYTAWDAAFNASIATSGALPWLDTNPAGVARRRAFWEWWLRDAVPAAWNSVPEGAR